MPSSNLPLDILDEVASYLRTKQLLSLCRVSKGVLPYSQRHLYRSIRLDNDQANRLMKHSSRHLMHTTSLHFVTTTSQDPIKTKQIVAFIRSFGRHDQLRSLALLHKGSSSDFFVFSVLQELISSLSNLNHLEIGITLQQKGADTCWHILQSEGATFTVDSFVATLLGKLENKPAIQHVDIAFHSSEKSRDLVLMRQIFNGLDVSKISSLTMQASEGDWALMHLQIAVIQSSTTSSIPKHIKNTLSQISAEKLQSFTLFVPTQKASEESQWRKFSMDESARTKFEISMVSGSLEYENIEFLVDTRSEDLWSWSLTREEKETSKNVNPKRAMFSMST
ncbi:hypothetical protein DL96DRAFT_1551561 [Flagelloscypha sp. PMI_526]|nr:hypothetical protein DL96DRAFT_1551561 [Flagelloscypha sp. PMI_526]